MIGTILIVAKNNLALTKKCVKSALGQNVECYTMVLDNRSTDGTLPWLRTKPVGVITVNGGPKSLAACWNYAMDWTFYTANGGELLVLNNDVEIPPHYYRALRNCDLPFVSGVGVDDRGKAYCNNYSDLLLPDLLANARPHPDFSAFMIRPEVVDKVGTFDEDYYPAYCEDSDYHVRMHRAGIRAVCVDVPYYHMGAGAQTVKNSSPKERRIIEEGAEKNRERFRLKYGCLPGTPEYEKLFT